jgi:hypothetical protein
MSHERGGWRGGQKRKEQKKCQVLFEWPLIKNKHRLMKGFVVSQFYTYFQKNHR